MDRILPRDIRSHGNDLYAVLAHAPGGKQMYIVPLTKISDQGVFRINDRYWLKTFGSLLMSSEDLGRSTTWVGELTATEQTAIAEAFQENTRREQLLRSSGADV